MEKVVLIVGAGQLGSRHLQALKLVEIPLKIFVVDPSETSLKVAKERYDAINGASHSIEFLQVFPKNISEIEVAIVASNSNVRFQILQTMLSLFEVKYLVLEKLLFDRKQDYQAAADLLKSYNTKTFVNCCMRMMPFYADLKKTFAGQKIQLNVTGSRFGLVTSSIHYIDYLAYLTGDTQFEVHSSGLDFPVVPSKRPGFSEINGTMTVQYSKGSVAVLSCFAEGSLPLQVELSGPTVKVISRETEMKAWIATESEGWKWKEIPAVIPYQSQMTAQLVQSLITTGRCELVGFEESTGFHLNLLAGLDTFMQKNKMVMDRYPFT